MIRMDIKNSILRDMTGVVMRIPILILVLYASLLKAASAAPGPLDIISTLNDIQSLLIHVGPVLSAVLFIVAGIFYAIGQLFPSNKRASLHSASIDIIIGAIIVAVLSVASTGLAVASTSLLSNATANAL